MEKLIIFLIRIKLGLKRKELFTFTNQKEDCQYFFNDTRLLKVVPGGKPHYSHVSLNWIMKCQSYTFIKRTGRKYE